VYPHEVQEPDGVSPSTGKNLKSSQNDDASMRAEESLKKQAAFSGSLG
jgi:hypothetical protein